MSRGGACDRSGCVVSISHVSADSSAVLQKLFSGYSKPNLEKSVP